MSFSRFLRPTTRLFSQVPNLTSLNSMLAQINSTRDFNIRDFMQVQQSIQSIEPHFRTMGPEFEFARIIMDDPGTVEGVTEITEPESLPLHVDLASSETSINGLNVVFETDAGNVIELAMPPFVIATSMDNWQEAQETSMIVTEKIETTLKNLAEDGAKRQPPMTLEQLLDEASELFGIPIIKKGATFEKFKNRPVGDFRKGVAAFTNDMVGKEDMTNSQINLKMSISELGQALRKGYRGGGFHMAIKNTVNIEMLRRFGSQEAEIENFRERIATMSYYLSQIPMMAFQNLMNQVRYDAFQESLLREGQSPDSERALQLKHENRVAFKASHRNNGLLLLNLSRVKDFMGFWIKASLNDLMRLDPMLKQLIAQIDPNYLKDFLRANSIRTWQRYKIGLEAFNGNPGSLDGAYEEMLDRIVDNMQEMARKPEIPRAINRTIPNFKEQGTDDLIDFQNGAPFMVRPDTYVNMKDTGVLVEIRGLNKAITRNPFMRSFQMPYFRVMGELAGNDPNWFDMYDAQKQLNKDDSLKIEVLEGAQPDDRRKRKRMIERIQARNQRPGTTPLGNPKTRVKVLTRTSIGKRSTTSSRERTSSRSRSTSDPSPVRKRAKTKSKTKLRPGRTSTSKPGGKRKR